MFDVGIGRGIIRKWFGQQRPRGAAVPFEAPALRMARICDDERDGLIAILRDFANNGSAYIVPWTSLPLMAPMTEHDLALHKAVGEAKASTPAQVRAVVSDLALSGSLGHEAKTRELESTQADHTRLADVELVLILHLLNACNADLADLMVDPARWRDKDAKSAVAAAAETLGVKRKDIYQRVAEFTRLLAPVGLASTEGAIQSGWLRVLHGEIEAFAERLSTLPQPNLAPRDEHLAAIAESAKRTTRISGIVLSMLDYAALDIVGTIRRWTGELPILKQAIERLSMMLDEWPELMKSVHDALRGPPEEVTKALRIVRSMLPKLPDMEPAMPPDRGAQDQNGATSVSQALGSKLSPIWSMLHATRSTD